MTAIFIVLLLFMSALFSGLTLGLLSLDITELERKANLGSEDAKKILPVRKNGNLLLCTLLLGNVTVNTTLSVLLADITTGLIATLVSTGLIVIFGEIIPQSVISRHAMTVGAKTIMLTKIFTFILFPLAWPLAFFLNRFLGEELPTIWTNEELKEIIKLHEDHPESPIDADEERIIIGTLTFSEKSVKEIMTPRTVVFALDAERELDTQTLDEIKHQRFSRIPVYSQRIDNIIGTLYTKDLIGIEPGTKIKNIYKTNNLIKVTEKVKLDELLNKFIHERKHLAFVYDEFGGLAGIVTSEDVIEEILQKEVYDEGEKIRDPRKEARILKNKQRLSSSLKVA